MNQASDTILKTRTMYIIKVTEQNIPYYKDINDSLNKKVTLFQRTIYYNVIVNKPNEQTMPSEPILKT